MPLSLFLHSAESGVLQINVKLPDLVQILNSRSMIYLDFNQDSTSLVVAGSDGYSIYTLLENGDASKVRYKNTVELGTGTSLINRLYSTSLIVVVYDGSPHTIRVCHFKKGTEICTSTYTQPVLSVKLNRKMLVVCTETSFHMHGLRDMKEIHQLQLEHENSAGLFALSVADNTALLAYPHSAESGILQLFDCLTLSAVMKIHAHDNPLAAISFSKLADKVATASSKGTVIRIFSTIDSTKLFEFRRGLARYVTISSLAFSHDDMYLASSSNTETVHIFRLDQEECVAGSESTWSGYVASALTSTAASIMPLSMSSAFNAWRAVATARLPEAGLPTKCAFSSKSSLLYVVDSQACLHVFQFNRESGGECALISTKRIDMSSDDNCAPGEEIKAPPVVEDNGVKDVRVVDDISYAYKLKREKRVDGSSTSDQLDEILANVPNTGGGGIETDPDCAIRLDDTNEFPPMK